MYGNYAMNPTSDVKLVARLNEIRERVVIKKKPDEYVILPDGSKIKNHPRHDFDKPTKLLLQHMVAGVCSNPDCLNHTVGSNLERNNYAGNGVAAHICAAAPGPGAARYDKAQSQLERKSYKNGIWLCASCSVIIDHDEVRYPTTLLHEWKRRAEVRAMSLIGQRSITPFELSETVRNEVVKALTFSFKNSSNPLNAPVLEFFSAYKQSISELDSRFEVSVSVSEKGIFHRVSAKPGEKPKISLKFKTEDIEQKMKDAWMHLVNTGESIEIPLQDFDFVGSPLFEAVSEKSSEGRLIVGGVRKKIDTVIYLVADNGDEFELATIESESFSGKNKFQIQGEALGGVLSFKYHHQLTPAEIKLELNFSLLTWQDKPFNELPSFNKALKAARFIAGHSGVRISIEFFFKDEPVRIGEELSAEYEGFFSYFRWMIQMLEKGRAIAGKINEPLILRSFVIEEEDELRINQYYHVIEGSVVDSVDAGSEVWNAEFSSLGPDMMKAIDGQGPKSEIFMSQIEAPNLVMFGNTISPPPLETKLIGFELCLYSEIADRTANVKMKLLGVEGSQLVRTIKNEPWVLVKEQRDGN